MKTIPSLFICILLCLPVSQSLAYELLVLSGETSQNSKRWSEEVLPDYEIKDFGKKLPVKIVPIRGTHFPDWLSQALRENRVGEILGTPTFIIWDLESQKEMGRIEGYTQKPLFFSQLKDALAMLEQGLTPGRREGSGGNMHREGLGGKGSQEGSGGGRSERGPSISRDIMDHMYKNLEDAKRASEMLGFGGQTHSHETENGTIYMPGPTM